jgi:RND family efflux transporter MFP subunit
VNKTMTRMIWAGVAVLVVIGLVAVRMRRVHEKETAPTVGSHLTAVQVVTVREGRAATARHVLGTVVGTEEVDLASRVTAQVLAIRVREGDPVRRGQVLAELDARELADAVAAAEAPLLAAKEGVAAAETAFAVQQSTTARDRVLVDARAIAQEQWDRSRAAEAAAAAQREAAKGQLTIAERRLSQARTQLGYAQLTAPFDGVVAARLADPGTLAVPGRPIIRIMRERGIRVRAALPAGDFAQLRTGQTVMLRVGDTPVAAHVSRVVPAMGDAHLAAFEVDLADPPTGLVSGATVGVDVALGGAAGLVVPQDALLESGRGTFVFRVVDGVIHPAKVDVLMRSSGEAVVRGAVAAGDRIVQAQTARLMTLAEGTKVRASDEAHATRGASDEPR